MRLNTRMLLELSASSQDNCYKLSIHYSNLQDIRKTSQKAEPYVSDVGCNFTSKQISN